MDAKAIGKVHCEDCGPSLVMESSRLSVFFDGDDYNAITECIFCHKCIYLPISEETMKNFAKKGVKVFSWLTGEEVRSELV